MKKLLLLFSLLITSSITFASNECISNEKVNEPDLMINELELLENATDFIAGLSSAESKSSMNLDVNNLYIGTNIPVYIYENGLLKLDPKMTIKPIFSNKEIIALATIHKLPDNSLVYTFGVDYAHELSKYLNQNGTDKYGLCYDFNDISVVSSEGIHKIFDLKSFGLNNERKISSNSKSRYQEAALSLKEIVPELKLNLSNITAKSSERGVPSSVTIPVEIVTQDYTNSCWAAVMSCIGYQQTNIRYSQDEIVSKIDFPVNVGADIYAIRKAYNLYNISYDEVTSKVDDANIIKDMIASNPIFAIYVDSNFTASHSVAVVGYRTSSSSMGLVLMDPNFSSFRYSYYHSNVNTYTNYHPNYGYMEWYSSYRIK